MPALVYDKFGGMMPKVDPRVLPRGMAQIARNVDISSGKLKPVDNLGPFRVLHDKTTGKMIGEISQGDIANITKPDAPVVAEEIRLFVPEEWTWTAFAGAFFSYYDDDGEWQSITRGFSYIGTPTWDYTRDGAILRVPHGNMTFSAVNGRFYYADGPKYGFHFDADTSYYGGPETDFKYPADGIFLDFSSQDVPIMSMPLTAPISYENYPAGPTGDRYVYGYMELIDVKGPIIKESHDFTDKPSASVEVAEEGEIQFYFRNNYLRNTDTYTYYMQSQVDQRTAGLELNQGYGISSPAEIECSAPIYGENDIADSGVLRLTDSGGSFDDLIYSEYLAVAGIYTFTITSGSLTRAYLEDDGVLAIDLDAEGMEGPPSQMTDRIILDPGMILKLTTTRPTGYYRSKIYRSSTGGDDFRELEDELEADIYYDNFLDPLGVPLPPYGNFPQLTVDDAITGSVVTPFHWAATFFNNLVYPTPPFAHNAYPDEYTIPLNADIMAMAVSGASLIVWTAESTDESGNTVQGKVYRVAGSNPEYLTKQLLTEGKPLLSVKSIAKIDQTVYYVTTDGLMAIPAGGNPKLVSENFFTRELWDAYEASLFSSYTADNALYLVNTGTTGKHLRFDFGENGSSMLSLFTGFNDLQGEWLSPIAQFPMPVNFRCIQVWAEKYPVAIRLHGDRNRDIRKQYDISIPSGDQKLLPMMQTCMEWEVEILTNNVVTRVAVASSVGELL